jgi:hypothetical protein
VDLSKGFPVSQNLTPPASQDNVQLANNLFAFLKVPSEISDLKNQTFRVAFDCTFYGSDPTTTIHFYLNPANSISPTMSPNGFCNILIDCTLMPNGDLICVPVSDDSTNSVITGSSFIITGFVQTTYTFSISVEFLGNPAATATISVSNFSILTF